MLNACHGMPERCEHSLGRAKMPEGYELWRDEDGYYWWYDTDTKMESEFDWNRWRIRRGAIRHSQMKAN